MADPASYRSLAESAWAWSQHYGTPAYFDNPFLDADACRRLLDSGVRTICIDAINLDETPDDEHRGRGSRCTT